MSSSQDGRQPGVQVAPWHIDGATTLLRPSRAARPLLRAPASSIAEVHYHPPPPRPSRNLEFIELFNPQPWPEDLSGFRLSGSVEFTFPSNTTIDARGYLVVAAVRRISKPCTATRAPSGPGRRRTASPMTPAPSASAIEAMPCCSRWTTLTCRHGRRGDGAGHSLVLARPSYGEGDPRAWQRADAPGGSPGSNEVAIPHRRLANVVLNELLAHPPPTALTSSSSTNYSTQSVDLACCVSPIIRHQQVHVPARVRSSCRSAPGPRSGPAPLRPQKLAVTRSGSKRPWRPRARRRPLRAQEQAVPLGRTPDGAAAWTGLKPPRPEPRMRPRC